MYSFLFAYRRLAFIPFDKPVGDGIKDIEYDRRSRREYQQHSYRVEAQLSEHKELSEEYKGYCESRSAEDKHSRTQRIQRKREPQYQHKTYESGDIYRDSRDLGLAQAESDAQCSGKDDIKDDAYRRGHSSRYYIECKVASDDILIRLESQNEGREAYRQSADKGELDRLERICKRREHEEYRQQY